MVQQARENSNLVDRFKRGFQASSRSAVTAALPGISGEIQKVAEAQAVDLVKKVSDLIPGQADMVILGNRLVADIEKAINENILPQLYNRVSLGAAFISDSELQSIYNNAVASIPSRTTFTIDVDFWPTMNITLDLKRIVQAGLPFSKFMEMVRKVEPLTSTVKSKTLPLIEGRVKDVAGFTLFTGILVGGAITFGYMKLYQSID